MQRILIIEDEDNIRDVCRRYMEREGFQVSEARDGEEGWQLFEREQPDLVVMDLMLPKRDGYELCQEIRRESDTPVIMLTARSDERDRVMGLTLGADDYITKPFSPRELILRIQNIFRRMTKGSVREEEGKSLIQHGDIVVDPVMRRVTLAGRAVDLTVKEFDVLHTLASRPGAVYSKGQLLEMVWGYESEVDTSAVTVLIRRLREKMEDNPSEPQWIHTVWGIGYRFERMGENS